LTWYASARLGVGSARHGYTFFIEIKKWLGQKDNLLHYGAKRANKSGKEIKGAAKDPTASISYRTLYL